MGKKYTTDEIEVGGHMLDASMMTSLNTVVTDSTSYITTLPSHNHDILYHNSTNSIDVVEHSGHTWLRNAVGQWTFQSGNDGDDWTKSFTYHLPVRTTDNAQYMELGQRNSNGAEGSYKGVRIVKYSGSDVVDGDLKADNIISTGTISNGSVWINDGTNYNGYNENIRLFNPANNVSVIAFAANGVSGTPVSSILGYSDRHEVRIGTTWRTRTYGGYFEVNGDARATLFYDSNNTVYYVNPANTSRFKALELGVSNTTDQGTLLIHGYTANKTSKIMTTDGNLHLDAAAGNYATYINFYTGTGGVKFGNGATGTNAEINSLGILYANQARASWFYDSDNTNYYVNPAGISKLYQLRVDEGDGGMNSNFLFGQAGSQEHRLFGAANQQYNLIGSSVPIFKWGQSATDGNHTIKMTLENSGLNVAGVLTATGGTSTEWNTAYTHSQAAHAPSNAEANVYSTPTELLTAIKTVDGSGSGLDADKLDGFNSGQNGANVVLRTAGNGYLYVNNWIHPANGTGLFYDAGVHFHETGNYMYSNTSLQAANDMRAPSFYDRDNTGYYVNPSSTSNFNVVNSSIFSGTISTSGDGQNNTPFKLGSDYNSYMVTAAGNTWGLFWAGNSGARYGTNGVGGPGNIWSNSTNPNEFVFVGSDSTKWTVHGGTGKTWQAGTGQSATDFRAPIFYDSNNTGYYVNPASTSNLNGLTVQSTITGTTSGNVKKFSRLNANADTVNETSVTIWDVSGATDDPPGASDGLLTTNYWDSSNWATQNFHDFHNNKLYIRSKQSGTWQTSWDTVATQAWVTSNANSSNANLLDGLNSTQFLRSDANDSFTGNLTTGAGNHITFGPNTTWGSSLRIGGNGHTATGTEMASVVTTDGNLHLDAADSTSSIYLNFYAGTGGVKFGNGAGTYNANMTSSGILYANQVRATIFYDSDNTNYYVNPAATDYSGVFRQHVTIGDSSQYKPNSGNWGARLNVVDNVHAKITVGQDADDMLSVWYAHTGQNSAKFGMESNHNLEFITNNNTRLTVDTGGNVQATTSLRAPIFYDSNDTNYYVNPTANSIYNTSQISYLGIGTAANTSGGYRLKMGGSIDMNNATIDYVSQLHFHDNVRFYDDGNDSYLNFKYGDSNAGGIRIRNAAGTQKGFLYADGGGFGLLDSDGMWAVRTQTGTSPIEFRCDNNPEFYVYNSYTLSPGSSRAPIFYDSDDTSYFVNPSSTSNLNLVTASSVTVSGNVEHQGLTMTEGTDVDQVKTFALSLTPTTTDWMDTGINYNDLANGTYSVQCHINNSTHGSYDVRYSGMMSWFGSGSTNDTSADEIHMHRAGHAPNQEFSFRTLHQPSSVGTHLKFQIKSSAIESTAATYTFKFRRLI